MKTLNIQIPIPGKQSWVVLVSVLLSVFFVAAMVYGATTIDTGSIGIATSTPGAALGVKGAGLFEGFVHADYFLSTSTSHASGFGTSSPGAEFAVAGGALFEGGVTADFFSATSTATSTFSGALDVTGNSTSTFAGGLAVDVSTFTVDADNNRVGIGTTTPGSDLVIGSGSASTTLFMAGGPSVGGEIILKSSDGSGCIVIIATRGSIDVGAVATLETLIHARVIDCPAE